MRSLQIGENIRPADTPPRPTEAPIGFEFTGEFRLPHKGDTWYAGIQQMGGIGLLGLDALPNGPRWILRNIRPADTAILQRGCTPTCNANLIPGAAHNCGIDNTENK